MDWAMEYVCLYSPPSTMLCMLCHLCMFQTKLEDGQEAKLAKIGKRIPQ